MKHIIHNDKGFANKKEHRGSSLISKILLASLFASYNMSMNYVVAANLLCCKSCMKHNKASTPYLVPRQIVKQIIKGNDDISSDVVLKSLEQTDMNKNILAYLMYNKRLNQANKNIVVNKIVDSICDTNIDDNGFTELLSKNDFGNILHNLFSVVVADKQRVITEIVKKLCKLNEDRFYSLMLKTITLKSQEDELTASNLVIAYLKGNDEDKTNIVEKLCELNEDQFCSLMLQTKTFKTQKYESTESNLVFAYLGGSDKDKTNIVEKLCTLKNENFLKFMKQTGSDGWSNLMWIMKRGSNDVKTQIAQKLCNKDCVSDSDLIELLGQTDEEGALRIDVITQSPGEYVNVIIQGSDKINNVYNKLISKLGDINSKTIIDALKYQVVRVKQLYNTLLTQCAEYQRNRNQLFHKLRLDMEQHIQSYREAMLDQNQEENQEERQGLKQIILGTMTTYENDYTTKHKQMMQAVTQYNTAYGLISQFIYAVIKEYNENTPPKDPNITQVLNDIVQDMTECGQSIDNIWRELDRLFEDALTQRLKEIHDALFDIEQAAIQQQILQLELQRQIRQREIRQLELQRHIQMRTEYQPKKKK